MVEVKLLLAISEKIHRLSKKLSLRQKL